ncbi:MAG: CmcI family methyltransferase [Nanoarchaeota archaeon]|nr:CmcI family methyltransferase [Nanoarchaeota archaeon]
MKNSLQLLKSEIAKFRDLIYSRIYISPKSEREIIDKFHKLYFDSNRFGKTWGNTFWLGVQTHKCPLDCWIYQEIIFDIKPDVIIECGTKYGGSALFLASICDLINKGRIISIDINIPKNLPQHNRIKYLEGSSTSDKIIEKVKSLIGKNEKVLIVLDSNHTKQHVLDELRIYNKFVTKGSYLIVEDTHLNGHPVMPKYGPGPMEAVKEFFKENNNFIIDKTKEKLYMTFNPNGYLKKIK